MNTQDTAGRLGTVPPRVAPRRSAPSSDGFGARLGPRLRAFLARERVFLVVFFVGLLAAATTYSMPAIAMWVGFGIAAYAVVANDSIQTIGTFLASNKDQKWWVLWLFIAGLFLITVTYSWVQYDGDVTYQRLAAKGFAVAPTNFAFLQIAAPLVLLVLTRLRMPVSTTFLLLTSFATSASGVGSVLSKSVAGWAVALVAAFAMWMALSKVFDRYFTGEAHPAWRVAQWITSGSLWCIWIMQDAANIAVYLPRSLSVWHFAGFAGAVVVGLGVLFKNGGERVQEVVDEKSDVVDVRSATMIDLLYAAILYYFKVHSNVPMSTTWVFVGLLGGREIAMALRKTSGRTWQHALKLMLRDLSYVAIGLLVSMVLAYIVNDAFRQQIDGLFGA